MIAKDEISGRIAACVRDHQLRPDVATRWRTPLVGAAAASEPGFVTLREVVRSSHALPGDLLPGARSVVAFFLPFEPWIGASNRRGWPASAVWARAYLETNRLIAEICAAVGALLRERGYQVREMPATHNFDPVALKSDWSHRHVAYITGLGSFGLNNMLITERGCCGRLGSLVTSAQIESNPGPLEERCLYKRDGSCQECVDRCPTGALQTDRFDRQRCYQMCLENEQLHHRMGRADVCGKCVVKLPCSHVTPRVRRRR